MQSHDSGSTTFEALTAVLILSVAGAAALAAATGGMRAYRASRAASVTAARALAVDDALRSVAREIRVPLWERRYRVESDGRSMQIAYWRALAEASLRIEGTDAGLALVLPEGSRFFEKVQLTYLGPVPDGDAPPRGIRADYTIGDRSFSTVAEFGARPLGTTSAEEAAP
jgi:hypothetical protein